MPLTDADKEAIETIKQGQGFRVSLTKVSDRSIKHHKLYWGGLVQLVSDYWNPVGGIITEDEKAFCRFTVNLIASQGYDSKPIEQVLSMAIKQWADQKSSIAIDTEKTADRLYQIHQWLKKEAGYVDRIATPTGIIEEVRSINFNAMPSEAEFNEFYKRVFSVAWRHIFSNNNFASQEEAEQLALQMSMMG